VYYKKVLGKILFEDIIEEEPCVRSFHSLVALEFTKICGKSPSEVDDELLLLIGRMKDSNERDLELIRRILKHINYYEINLSSEDKINQLFKIASVSTNEDWVVCHQYSNYLLHRNEFEAALTWLDRASRTNPRSAAIKHTKGNILRRWGMNLELRGDSNGANGKFEEARKYFALSRIGTDPSEYGYVTHLDMLLSLIDKRDDEIEIANMTAEGAQIYKEGVKAISEDRFNLLLDKRFSIFRLENGIVEGLLEKIEKGIGEKRASVYAISFLAEYYYSKGNYEKAIELLDSGKTFISQGILLWLKEAEIHARESNFNEAIRSIDSAKRRVDSAENEEIAYSLIYWDLVISFIYKNYDNAKKCAIKLINTNYFPGRSFPRGYLWRREAKGKNPGERSFKKDAILFKGRVQNVRASEGNYGRIEMNNVSGDIFYINFNKKYFPRRDIRPGQPIQFAVALLSEGLRAESIDSKPFVNTKDDLFLLK